jgi:hypothetical protein
MALMTVGSSNQKLKIENRKSAFCWQGWQFEFPARWNPVKLEGDYAAGFALIADMNRPQLGIRWRTMRKVDPPTWTQRVLRDEVGRSAAAQAAPLEIAGNAWVGSTLFLEPEPPGRDVWVARSTVSERVIEIVHHVRRRDRLLRDAIVPALIDTAPDSPQPWAVFDLVCTIPAGYELKSHRLNTGDLGLTFARKRATLAVRQIALAEMALKRMPLNHWLAAQLGVVRRHFGPAEPASDFAIAGMNGVRRDSVRRRRYAFMRSLPLRLTTWLLHDVGTDRLVFVQGSDEVAMRQVVASFASAGGV